jgi:hypothetical protein
MAGGEHLGAQRFILMVVAACGALLFCQVNSARLQPCKASLGLMFSQIKRCNQAASTQAQGKQPVQAS